MTVEFEQKKQVCIMRLKGKIATGSDAAYLREKAEQLKSMNYGKVVVDCHELPYLDSTGIAFLVGIFTSVRNAGGDCALVQLNPRVREVLDLTHLTTVIPVHDTEQSALAAFAASK
jgi:stage II sporulation protein AA (anti-sigma F factor antagonist)